MPEIDAVWTSGQILSNGRGATVRMTTLGNVEQLRVGQCVTLDLGKAEPTLDCVVTEIAGATATLVQRADHEPQILERLSSGLPAYLVISQPKSVIGLRGAAIVTPQSRPLIEFVVTDGITS